MLRKHIYNNQGAIIPLSLMVFTVLIILTAATMSISIADNRYSIYQNNKMQAHYIARSGAETMAAYLIEKSYRESFTNMNNLLDDISNKTSNATSFLDGNFTIKTVRKTVGSKEKLDIISTGNYRGVSDSVTVTLVVSTESGGGAYNPSSEENALVALSEDSNIALELSSGAFIQGDVAINSTKENSIKFSGGSNYNIRNGSLYLKPGTDPKIVISTDRGSTNGEAPPEYKVPGVPNGQWYNNWAFWKNIENGVKFSSMPSYPSSKYPEPVFPSFPNIDELPQPANPNFTTPWVESLYYPITEDGYYNSIQPSSSRTITIDLAGGNRIIRVNNLNLTGGNIELKNVGENGKLFLYVDNSFALGSSRSLNENGIPDNVYIYYAGSQTVQIDGSSKFSGNLFVKNADINFTAGANMKGNIVTLGTYVNIAGGSSAHGMILYAPRALVNMSGSAQIKGSVIAETFKRSGGSNAGIIFAPTSFSIPGEFFGTSASNIVIRYDQNPWR
ncbi:hypothetical protein SAMN02745975_00121 [Geosporobacter subterraneus DSM 17957]|uniref:DUF7305 domain-containing protein n=1 Tax=Geosporobacter subterraneus DSM 17957 TaxID=1121919 RepID=A0A1M6C0K5_9FIRM|nr:hypothetical protein SAMN02745975_00121 [Geosporobacter subterraneus DSM 17957]